MLLFTAKVLEQRVFDHTPGSIQSVQQTATTVRPPVEKQSLHPVSSETLDLARFGLSMNFFKSLGTNLSTTLSSSAIMKH